MPITSTWPLKHLTFLPDAIHAVVQPSGQIAPAEVVRRPPGQTEKENHQGADNHDSGEKAENVQLPRMARSENRLQTVVLSQKIRSF